MLSKQLAEQQQLEIQRSQSETLPSRSLLSGSNTLPTRISPSRLSSRADHTTDRPDSGEIYYDIKLHKERERERERERAGLLYLFCYSFIYNIDHDLLLT